MSIKNEFQTGNRFIVLLFFFIVSMIVALQPTICDGLQFLFVLPLVSGIVIFLFWEAVVAIKNEFVLLILFGTVIIRYALSPLLMALSQSKVTELNSPAGCYVYAIVIMITELLAVVLAIKKYFCFGEKEKFSQATSDIDQTPDIGIKPTVVGIFAILGFVAILILRGNMSNVFSHMSFGLNIVRNIEEDVYTFDMNCFIALKAIAFLVIASFCYHRYKRSSSIVWVLIAVLAGLINILIYDYSQRMLIVEISISTLVSLSMLFPKHKKLFFIATIVVMLTVVSTLFLTHTLHFDEGLTTVVGNNDALSTLSRMVEVYTNGVTNIAYSLNTYSSASRQMSISVFVSELIKNIGLFRFPVLRTARTWVSSIPDTTAIWHSVLPLSCQGFIIPPIAQANYYFTPILGWIFNVVYFVMAIKLLSVFTRKKKESDDIAYKYIWTFLSVLCALCFCYNARILLHTFTYIPLYMLIICFFNKIGHRVYFTLRRR